MSKPPRKFRLETLFQRIGEVSVVWAYLEMAIDFLIQTIHSDWGGEKASAQIPTVSFAKKVAYLRDWYASDERWPVLFPSIDKFFDMIEAASEHRHRVIHGVAMNIRDYQSTGVAEMVRRRRTKTHHFEETAQFRLKELRTLRGHIIGLATFAGVVLEIFTDDPAHDSDQSFRALFVEIGGFFPVPKRTRKKPR